MNIGLFLYGFSLKGGIERLAVSLATEMVKRGHHCTLFHPHHEKLADAYPVPGTVSRVTLLPLPITAIWLKHAKAQLHAAHLDVLCIMSSGSYARIFPALCQGLHTPLVLSERNAPNIIETERWNHSERLACMAAADAVHLLCRDFLLSLPSALRERATVIPNFSNLSVPVDHPVKGHQRKRLLTVARLEESQKQLSVLLRAFALLQKDFPDWECRICGEGLFRKYYEGLLVKLNLTDKVSLPGAVEDVSSEYAAADLFVLPSRYEGFPNALGEAQLFGLPAVGFAACPGVNEIIVHGENGLLAPEMTAESLVEHLRGLMADEALRQRMGVRARVLSARYDKERVLDQWEDLFRRVAGQGGPTALDAADDIEDAEIRATLHSLLTKPLMATKNSMGTKYILNMLHASIKQSRSS